MWYIIANPASARGAVQQRWPLIEALLQEMGFSYTIRFTERRGHATLLAEEAVLRGHRQILGIGGDGTNHEIVNGLFRQQQVQYVQDDGQAAERYFANVAGLAYDGFIGKKIDSFKGVIYNKAQYLAMVARYLMAFRPEPLEVTFGDQRQRDAYYTVNVGLCRYSGGGMQLVPHAVPDDGLFALTLAGRLAKWEVLLQTPRFYNGKLLEHPKVQGFQTDALTVRHLNDTPSCLEADGEYLGVTPAVFRILPRALKVAL
jgi:diacylglycerol kinase (ATP)